MRSPYRKRTGKQVAEAFNGACRQWAVSKAGEQAGLHPKREEKENNTVKERNIPPEKQTNKRPKQPAASAQRTPSPLPHNKIRHNST